MQAAVNEPLNLGNPQEMTLLEVAKRIRRLTSARSELVSGRSLDDPKVPPATNHARATRCGREPRVDKTRG